MASAVSPFILYPDDRLQRAAPPQPVDEGLRTIGAALLQAATDVQAYGLAAVHIGHVAPLVVISLSEATSRDYRVLYNPRILATHGPETRGKEGSVSMPGIEVDVIRPEGARIAFDDDAGNRHELELSGFAARVAQHEIDQVNGLFFLSRVSRLKRDTAVKRFAKIGRDG